MPTVIAIDLDEVLGSFIPSLCKFHNEAYSTSLSPSDFDSYRFCEVWGGDDEEATTKVHDFFTSPHFDDLPVIPGAKSAVAQLRSLGYDLVLVTSRQLVIEAETRGWLDRHFPTGTFSKVALGNHWGKEGRKFRKVDLCRELGAQILIDDSLAYVNEMAHAGMKGLLFDLDGSYAWNRSDEPLKEGITRVYNWEQAVEYIQKNM